MTDEADVLRVAQIIKPHGVEGELAVDVFTDFPDERFATGQELLLLESEEEQPTVTVENSRWHQERILLTLQEISDRDRAEQLRDCWLVVPEDAAVDQAETVYGHELLNLTVRDREGENRGQITAVHPDRMNPLAEISMGDDVLDFPLSEDLIAELNPEEGFIVLNFPEGWEKLKRS